MAENVTTAADAFLEAMKAGGIDMAFSVFGTDHAGLIESWARHARGAGRPVPRLVTCQHENVAIHAALGYAFATGRAQAVIAHVDVGTANLGNGLHNASRNQLPVFLYAGVAPFTENGERKGGRNHEIQWMQDVADQPGLVREYLKWEYQVRAGTMFPAAVARGLQIAHSWPRGPVYVTSSREPLEEVLEDAAALPPMAAAAAAVTVEEELAAVARLIAAAERPVVVANAAGAAPGGVEAMVAFAEAHALPVLEHRPHQLSFPGDHELHVGYNADAAALIEAADLVIAVECDVPWIPVRFKPPAGTPCIHIGAEPTSRHLTMRSMRADRCLAGSVPHILAGLTRRAAKGRAAEARRSARRARIKAFHDRQRAAWQRAGKATATGLTSHQVGAMIRAAMDDNTVLVHESPTGGDDLVRQVRPAVPGSLLGAAGAGLGFSMPAALGIKLARPDATVICVVGDGSYVFAVPTAVHWSAAREQAPFLTVVLNNAAWGAVAGATRSVHPDGQAARDGFQAARLDPPLKLSKVVEAAGGAGYEAATCAEFRRALAAGLKSVRAGTQAVIDARLSGPP